MMTYTPSLRLRTPDTGAMQWHDSGRENQTILDVVLASFLSGNRVISGCVYTWGSSPQVSAGVVFINGQYVSVQGAGLFLLDPVPPSERETYWVVVVDSGQVQVTSVPPTGDYVLIALAETYGYSDQFHYDVDLRIKGYGAPESPSQSGIDFGDADLVSGVLIYDHNLDVDFPASVTIWNDHKQIIRPNEVKSLNANSIRLDLSAFGTLSGTWRLSIRS